MGKLVRVAVMGLLLASTLYSVPFANASARRKPIAMEKSCRTLGICNQSCYRCISNQGCPDYPNEVCLCGASICP
jgi:hypothetical protein